MADKFPRRGQICLVNFPDDPKPRSALIVSPDPRNEYSNSVLAVPVTSSLTPVSRSVLLPAGEGGLACASMARCENISYIHKSRLSRGPFSGAISVQLMREIDQYLVRSLGML